MQLQPEEYLRKACADNLIQVIAMLEGLGLRRDLIVDGFERALADLRTADRRLS
jgi:hypothetical protein